MDTKLEIKKVYIKCKDCGEIWEKHYRKEFKESSSQQFWRPSKIVHYCENSTKIKTPSNEVKIESIT